MSRKSPSFNQLVDYIDKDGNNKDYFTHNMYSRDPQTVKREFFDNSKQIKKRKNGIFLYHEILSLEKNDHLTIDRQKEILHDITQKYVLERSSNAMVFGKLHEDTKHIHFHLMISANEINNSRKIRIDKNKFNNIQKRIEQYKLQQYPELGNRLIYSKPRDYSKAKNRESEYKNRTKNLSKTELVKNRLGEILKNSRSKDEFFRNLSASNLELYTRGKSIGIIDNSSEKKNRYRLKRLGLEVETLDIINTPSQSKQKEDVYKTKPAPEKKEAFSKPEDLNREIKKEKHQPSESERVVSSKEKDRLSRLQSIRDKNKSREREAGKNRDR